MQAKAFQVAGGNTPVAQMSFASQVPLAWQRKEGEDVIADRFSSKQIPDEPSYLEVSAFCRARLARNSKTSRPS